MLEHFKIEDTLFYTTYSHNPIKMGSMVGWKGRSLEGNTYKQKFGFYREKQEEWGQWAVFGDTICSCLPPSLSYASFCPIFLTEEKAQLSRPDQNYRGSQENEINMEVGRDKGSILTCPTLCLPRICSGPTAMILMDDGYVQRCRVLSKKTCWSNNDWLWQERCNRSVHG